MGDVHKVALSHPFRGGGMVSSKPNVRFTLPKAASVVLWLVGWTILVSQTCPPPPTPPIKYIYDDNGRLVAVIDPSQAQPNGRVYHYDGAGNLTAITTQNSSQVSVLGFTPPCGSTGTTVTIYGTGFTTGSTVKFNGTNATSVTFISATELRATTPGGATGPISVSDMANSNLSPFREGCGAPTITSFSPPIGSAGTAVTILGTNFDSLSANDRVAFNTHPADVGPPAPTTTSIVTAVPSLTGSGRIRVSTPFGIAVGNDFFVHPIGLPGTYTVANFAQPPISGRINLGDSRSMMIPYGQYALILFDPIPPARASLDVVSDTMPGSSSLWLRDPFGDEVGGFCFNASGCVEFMDATSLIPGTHTIVIRPNATGPGQASVSFTLYRVPPDIISPIGYGPPGVSLPLLTPGQNAVLTFAGTANHRVSALLENSGGAFNALSILNPYGTSIASVPVDIFIEPTTLPVDGIYTLKVDPVRAATEDADVTIYDVVDREFTVGTNGSPSTATVTTPGENANVRFTATNQQRVSVEMSMDTIQGPGAGARRYVSLKRPDGTDLISPAALADFFDTQVLSPAGTYTLFLDPAGPKVGSLTFKVYTVPADFMNTIQFGGTVPVTTTTPGQNAKLTFNSTGSSQVSVHVTFTTAANWVNVTLIDPSGGSVATRRSNANVFHLPATGSVGIGSGTYTIKIDPEGNFTGSMNVNLTSP